MEHDIDFVNAKGRFALPDENVDSLPQYAIKIVANNRNKKGRTLYRGLWYRYTADKKT